MKKAVAATKSGGMLLSVATCAAALACAGEAEAAGQDKVRCAAAYEQAQELRRQDKLAASREQLRLCQETCPRSLLADSQRWDGELDALIPTARLRATDAEGPTSTRPTSPLAAEPRITAARVVVVHSPDAEAVGRVLPTSRLTLTGHAAEDEEQNGRRRRSRGRRADDAETTRAAS